MNTYLVNILQIIVGVGLLNVWLLRFNKSTAFRGGTSANMLEEFAAYGLPAWFCYLIGFLKVSCALALLAGLLYQELVFPAAAVIALLMAGAISMHLRVKDPATKSLPAASVLIMCLIILAGTRAG